MKNFIKCVFVNLVLFSLFACASTNVAVNPSEIEYKEISAKEYFEARTENLYSSSKGYKVSDVYILGADSRVENGIKEGFLKLSDAMNSYNSTYIYATDFIKNTLQNDPTWAERLDAVGNNEKYNGHYTVFLYAKEDGNWIDGYTTKLIVYNIEGVPTQEQIDADKAEEARVKAEKQAADAKAKTEKHAKLNAKGKQLAKGYVYHGVEEDSKSSKLFANGALEEGHAYYISGFVVKYSGSMAAIEYGDGLFFSSRSSPVYVDYISQKVKAEVVESGVQSLFGQTIEIPLKVVVAGGKGFAKMPVVLGLIKDEE
ncbi:MAG: hypothetical protein K5873_00220 [Treponema sp.]|nr:hypothetical protein [Treponema sp.]